MKRIAFFLTIVIICGCSPGTQADGDVIVTQYEVMTRRLPDFIPTIRDYGGDGYDEFQINTLKELGFEYVQSLVDFSWINTERGDNVWKWEATDAQMDRLAANNLKTIAFIICPKLEGLHWDPGIRRNDPRFVAQYGEFAYELVHRYHNHPAWSGLVTIWGGSADVWDHNVQLTDPEVVVPLLNAAYDGVKRADPSTIVVGFNFATTAGSRQDWELYHTRAFALSPRFDWYGAQSHSVFTTLLPESGSYAGVQGLANVRRFLDEHGYADKPLWLNEGGFAFNEDVGGVPEETQAEQIVETYILAKTLDVNLKGWVLFSLFAKEHDSEDFGIMSSLDVNNPPQSRQAWTALKTLINDVDFFNYNFDAKISGETNQSTPFVLRFIHKERPASKLWVVFSPRMADGTVSEGQAVTIDISPATGATHTDGLGRPRIAEILTPDASGNITVISSSAPLYIRIVE